MVDGINRIYAGQINSVKSTQAVEKKDSARAERRRPADALIPDLNDRVEISEEGRKAAKSHGIEAESSESKESAEALVQNWYTAGYRMSVEESD